MPRFILASQSPRRKELLDRAGYDFEIIVSEVDETLRARATPWKPSRGARRTPYQDNAPARWCSAAIRWWRSAT